MGDSRLLSGKSDRTRRAGQSFALLNRIADTLMRDFSYSQDEAWEMIAREVLRCYRAGQFRPLTISQVLSSLEGDR